MSWCPVTFVARIAPLLLIMPSSETASCAPWLTRAIGPPPQSRPVSARGAMSRSWCDCAHQSRYIAVPMALYEPIRCHNCQRRPCELRVEAVWPSYRRTKSRPSALKPYCTSRDRPPIEPFYTSSGPRPCRNYAPNQICSLGSTAPRKQMHGQNRLDEGLPILRASLGAGCCMTLRRSC